MLDIIRSLALVLTVSALHVVAENANIAECDSEQGWIDNPNKDCGPRIYCDGQASKYCLTYDGPCAETCDELRVETNIPECAFAVPGWIDNPNKDCGPRIYCDGQTSVYCLTYDGPCAKTCDELRVETNIPECAFAVPGWIDNPNTACSPWIYCAGQTSLYCLEDYETCAATCAELLSNIPECVSKPLGFILNPDTSCSPYILCNGRESKYCYADLTCAAECVRESSTAEPTSTAVTTSTSTAVTTPTFTPTSTSTSTAVTPSTSTSTSTAVTPSTSTSTSTAVTTPTSTSTSTAATTPTSTSTSTAATTRSLWELCLAETEFATYPHTGNCHYFYQCQHGFLILQSCPFGFWWDVVEKSCQKEGGANCAS